MLDTVPEGADASCPHAVSPGPWPDKEAWDQHPVSLRVCVGLWAAGLASLTLGPGVRDWPSFQISTLNLSEAIPGAGVAWYMSKLAFYNPTLWTESFHIWQKSGWLKYIYTITVIMLMISWPKKKARDLAPGSFKRVGEAEGDGETTPVRIPSKWGGRTLSASRICFLCSTSWTSNKLVTSIPFCSAPNRECSWKYMFQAVNLSRNWSYHPPPAFTTTPHQMLFSHNGQRSWWTVI